MVDDQVVIEFRLTRAKARALDHEVHIANYVLTNLKELGVPIIGTLLPRVESGVLECTVDDLATDDYVYRWRPE